MPPSRIFLIGLSGSGKSTVARLVAERLGWQCADSDTLIEGEAGISIPVLFRDQGEAAFRDREAAVLERVAGRDGVVVATGGGAPTTRRGLAALSAGFVVWLKVSPAEAARRLAKSPATGERPLLAGDPAARLAELLTQRAPVYGLADAQVEVDGRIAEDTAGEVVAAWQRALAYGWDPAHRSGPGSGAHGLALPVHGAHWLGDRAPERLTVAAIVRTQSGTCPIFVDEWALDRLGEACREAGLGGRAFVLTDEAVGPLFVERAVAALVRAGYAAASFAVPAGEQHKTLATVSTVYDWLLGERVERSDFVVCLGGGVVTDLGGFVAATILRGIASVHVPTSLLAMVDAAIGGKTGVDHPLGKNMIGVFAQPAAVVIDPLLLRHLPERHLRNGWAEVVKHGLILDAALVADLEAAARRPDAMLSASLIARSVAIKAAIVSEDERESGRRTLLNYGHTFGHAIEAVTGYSTYLHGEAVAIGMRAAGLISVELGLLAPADFERQQALLHVCGLPERAPGVPVDSLLAATLGDKKVRGGEVQWVLLEGLGRATVRAGVPADIVRRAADAILS